MISTSQLRGAAVAALALATAAFGQMDPPGQHEVEVHFDSGPVVNRTGERGVIFSHVVHVPKVPWMRLLLDQGSLGAAPAGGAPTVLVITSFEDGAVQALDAVELRQWQYSSAYFNGDMVLVEIVADPGALPSRVSSSRTLAGPLFPSQQITICGPTDDRVLSEDPRVARIWPNGCTSFLIDDTNHCFLTAGHCTGSGFDIVEFNVPVSDPDGSANHPAPSDQYTIDQTSLQTNLGQGIGNDWGYFGAFANTQTSLTPGGAQGAFFVLSDTPPPVTGQTITITGFGTTQSPVPGELNRAQKTHSGPYESFSGTTVQYETDTTGGNSGSPVINEATGEVIGIHTHGGCGFGSGENSGTGINLPAIQDALANPQGVCVPPARCPEDCAEPPDGVIDIVDLLALLGQWGGSGSCAFSGENNVVDVNDLLALLGTFGSSCP